MSIRHDGGSLASYIIVAVVLVLLFAGGLYGLQRYNAAQNNPTVAQDQKEQPKEEPKAEPAKKDSESSKHSAAKDEARKETPVSTPVASDTEADKRNDASVAAETGKELPTTGPADTAMQLLAAASLTFAAVAYMRSRPHHWTKSVN